LFLSNATQTPGLIIVSM